MTVLAWTATSLIYHDPLSTSPTYLQSAGTNYISEMNSVACPITSYSIAMITGDGSALTLDPSSGSVAVQTSQVYFYQFQITACARSSTSSSECISTSTFDIEVRIQACKEYLSYASWAPLYENPIPESSDAASTLILQQQASISNYVTSSDPSNCPITSFAITSTGSQVTIDSTGQITFATDSSYTNQFTISTCARNQLELSANDCLESPTYTVIVGNCVIESRTSLPTAQETSIYADYIQNGTAIMLNKTANVNSISSYEVDCSLFFTNNCELTEFEILNVWDTQTATDLIQSNYNNILELNTATGLLTFLQFSQSIDIFVKVRSRDIQNWQQTPQISQIRFVLEPIVESIPDIDFITVENLTVIENTSEQTLFEVPECPTLQIYYEQQIQDQYICEFPNVNTKCDAADESMKLIDDQLDSLIFLQKEGKILIDKATFIKDFDDDDVPSDIVLKFEVIDDQCSTTNIEVKIKIDLISYEESSNQETQTARNEDKAQRYFYNMIEQNENEEEKQDKISSEIDLQKLLLTSEIREMSYLGQVFILFSENLIPVLSLHQKLNYTILSEPGLFFNLTFVKLDQQEDKQNQVNLTSWQILNFTENEMVIQLNMTNPLYVSAGNQQDMIDFKINEHRMFKRKETGIVMTDEEAEINQLHIPLPSQMKSMEDFERAKGMASQNSNVMGTGLIVCLVLYLIFKNLAIDLIWTTLGMIQLVSHIVNFEVNIPAQLSLNLDTIKLICNFQLQKISPIPDLINSVSGQLLHVVDSLGNVLTSIIVMSFIILIINLLYYAVRKNKKMAQILEKIKQKLMWSSLLRSLMQGYMVQTYTQLALFNDLLVNKQMNFMFLDYFKLIFAIFVALVFPVFTTVFLIKRKEKLLEDHYMGSYGTLYSNIRTFKKSFKENVYWVTLFLVKRLLIIFVTIWIKQTWAQIYFYINIQLFAMGHLVQYQPMISRTLNWMEFINDLFVLFCGQYLFLFTDIVQDVETRYDLGQKFTYMFLGVICIDGVILFVSVGQKVYRIIRLQKLKNEKIRLQKEGQIDGLKQFIRKELSKKESKSKRDEENSQVLVQPDQFTFNNEDQSIKSNIQNNRQKHTQNSQNYNQTLDQQDQISSFGTQFFNNKMDDQVASKFIKEKQTNSNNSNKQNFSRNGKPRLSVMFTQMRQRIETSNPAQIKLLKSKFSFILFAQKNQFIGVVEKNFKTVKEVDDFLYCLDKLHIIDQRSLLWKQVNHYRAVLEREERSQTKQIEGLNQSLTTSEQSIDPKTNAVQDDTSDEIQQSQDKDLTIIKNKMNFLKSARSVKVIHR